LLNVCREYSLNKAKVDMYTTELQPAVTIQITDFAKTSVQRSELISDYELKIFYVNIIQYLR